MYKIVRFFILLVAFSSVSFTSVAQGAHSMPMGHAEPPIFLASGAWVNSAVGDNITQRGQLYTTSIPVLGSVPPGSTITSVNYNWSLSYIPAGLSVYLCYIDTTACVDVSSYQSGGLSNFNGLNADNNFVYAFVVSGSGVLFPIAYGQSNQIIVNYQ